MPISPVDAITPAFHHTKLQLLQPYRFAQWAKLAVVGLLAGEMTSGGCSSPNFHIPTRPSGSQHFLSHGMPTVNPVLYAGLIAVLIVTALVLFVLFTYIGSVMRFVLFDSVIARRCDIAEGWHRRQRSGMRYFVWQLLFSFVSLATLTILVGVPAAFAYAAGWLKHAREHIIVLVLGGIALFFVLLAWLLVSVAVKVLTKDFVVPQMALEDLGPLQAWRRLVPMIESEKGNYAGYLGMKVVMSLGAAIAVAIIAVIAILIILIPVGGFGVIAVLIAKAAGLSLNVFTISVMVIFGCLLIAVIVYVIALISVPATVFFPAYSIYFFAARYPALAQLLHPAPSDIPPFVATPFTPLPDSVGG